MDSLKTSRQRLACGLVAVLLSSTSAMRAQTPLDSYLHTRYTVDDGLPTNMLTDAMATPDGYLWFGTQDGLVRYDGNRFVTFNTGNVEALTNNRIASLAPVPRGDFWILSEGHDLLRYHGGRFTRFDQHPELGGAPLYMIVPTAEGNRFVGRTGLYRYHDGGFEAIVEGKWNDKAQTLLVARDGAFWLGFQHSGAARIQHGEVSFFTRCQGQPINNVLGFLERPDGNLWLRTEHKLCKNFQNEGQGEILPIEDLPKSETHKALFRYNHDNNPNLAQPGKLAGYDFQGRPRQIDPAHWRSAEIPLAWDVDHVYTDVGGGRSTHIGHIMAVVQDYEGGIWLATDSDGLHGFRPVPMTAYGAEEGLTDRVHYSIAEDADGGIFAGGATTISRFDGRKFEPLLQHGSWWANLSRDRAGQIWFAGAMDPPHRFTGKGFEPFPPPRLPPDPEVVWQDRSGTRWFGGADGLHALHDGVWSHYGVDALPFPPNDLFETRDGALWLKSTEHGLARYHEGRFTVLNTEHGLPGNYVRYIHEDSDGILWLAVYGFGLVRVDLSAITTWDEDAFHQASLTHYRQRDGLFDDAVSAIVEDDYDRLWLSSNRGIFWIPKTDLEAVAAGRAERFHVAHYGVRDGMRNRETNGGSQAAVLVTEDGGMWFPTMDGIVALNPHDADHHPPLAVVFEQLHTGGEALLPSGEIALSAAQRSFEVEITVPVFAAPDQVLFRYRLKGYDNSWRETTQRRLTYTQVPGGDYMLQVRARGRGGLWSEAVAELKLEIEPFFHETWWFRASTVLVALLLVAGLVRLRVRRLLVRERQLESLVQQRTADLAAEKEKVAAQAEQLAVLDRAKSHFFANISHEFRTPLTLLIGPLQDSLAGRHGELPASLKPMQESMLRNSRRLLGLVEQLLDLARFEAGEQKLDLAAHDLGALVRQTARSFTPLAERLGVELTCETADLPDLYFDREKLEKVLLNLISNAFKFTPAGGRVDIVVDGDEQNVEIAVKDTGSGISAEDLPRIFERFYHTDERRPNVQASTGLGLSLARELTHLHGGTLRAESSPGQGSTFTVSLPRAAVALPEPPTSSTRDAPLPAPSESAAELPAPAPASPPPQGSDEPSDSPGVGTDDGDDDASDEGERATVLVIDDNEDVRRYVGSILRGEYRIVEAEDGAEGLRAARTHAPDLIVSDVMMPGLDGHALARALKEDPMTVGIPVILLTARASTEDRVAGLETGVDSYLTKPFEGAVLEAQVRNLIALRLRLRDLYRQGHVETGAPAQRQLSAFEERAREAVAKRLADDDFSVEALAAELFLSRSQLFRKLRDEADTTPTALIRTVRLEKAAQLLEANAGNVTEVAYAVGFKTLPHFTRCFREHFQSLPSVFLRAPNRSPIEPAKEPVRHSTEIPS